MENFICTNIVTGISNFHLLSKVKLVSLTKEYNTVKVPFAHTMYLENNLLMKVCHVKTVAVFEVMKF